MTYCKPTTLALLLTGPFAGATVHAAKVTDCAKVGLCYCINDEHKSAINAKIEKFRQVDRRAAQGGQGRRATCPCR